MNHYPLSENHPEHLKHFELQGCYQRLATSQGTLSICWVTPELSVPVEPPHVSSGVGGNKMGKVYGLSHSSATPCWLFHHGAWGGGRGETIYLLSRNIPWCCGMTFELENYLVHVGIGRDRLGRQCRKKVWKEIH